MFQSFNDKLGAYVTETLQKKFLMIVFKYDYVDLRSSYHFTKNVKGKYAMR
jgi:hypothetical protein